MKVTCDELYSIYCNHPAIVTDSRKITPGCLFFGLKGETFDGNDFATDAVRQGAAYAITDNPANEAQNIIVVEDTLRTLQDLAIIHRNRLKIPVIGITGSNGKTTTKELVHSVLSSYYTTHATAGNFNNHIGVPLTILSAPATTAVLIVEMGANHVGEIEHLCKISMPTHGLITNIGRAHLEGFGGFSGVVKAKSELYKYLSENQGLAFVNNDNPLLMSLSAGMQRTTYGTTAGSDLRGEILESDPFLSVKILCDDNDLVISSGLVGHYNFENVMAAFSIGKHFGVPLHKISGAISDYRPGNSRSQAIDTGRNRVIADFYNANPSSMKAAIENFSHMKSGKKMVILGDMFELGDESDAEHRAIVELVNHSEFDIKVYAGPAFLEAAAETDARCFSTSADVYDWLMRERPQGYTILLKGSRGSRMENVLPAL